MNQHVEWFGLVEQPFLIPIGKMNHQWNVGVKDHVVQLIKIEASLFFVEQVFRRSHCWVVFKTCSWNITPLPPTEPSIFKIMIDCVHIISSFSYCNDWWIYTYSCSAFMRPKSCPEYTSCPEYISYHVQIVNELITCITQNMYKYVQVAEYNR